MTKQQLVLVKKILWLRLISVSLIIFFIDLLTKFFFKRDSFQTTGHFVDISFVKNTGTLWSLFQSVKLINFIFIIFSIVVIAFLIYVFNQYLSKSYALSFGLLIGGITGNLFDRVVGGGVVDWINFHFWPVFNIADSAIVLGVILTLVFVIFYGEK